MQISIINLASDDPPATVECEKHMDVGTLKSLIEGKTRIPRSRQRILLPNRSTDVNDRDTLESLGLSDGDLVTVDDKARMDGAPSGQQTANFTPLAEQLMHMSQADPAFQQSLQEKQPELARAIAKRDTQAVAELIHTSWVNTARRTGSLPSLPSLDPRALNALRDPMSPDAQAYMLERIRQEQIDHNYALANEYLPESFGQVAMLYIQIEVNGTPVRAFVDSGAQATIMSEACAQRCGLDRLIDRRYRGLARGVGSAKLTGRIHMAQMKCGGVFFPVSFTIIENQTTDILMGLDLLKRHQCCIDLAKNCLRIADTVTVPFLSEAEVQQSFADNMLRSLVDTPSEANVSTTTEDLNTSIPPDVSAFNLTGSRLPSVRWDPSAPANQSRSSYIPPPAQNSSSPSVALSRAGEANVGGRQIEESKVKILTELGFTREEASRALRACNGNVDLAASQLFQSSIM
eukprot:Protomagalhaensia_sp_Gyna_25__1720@NODE_18_length_8108_cov_32_477630_g12_i0_p3_GENE_NODE_18_length_8108_cov_32_477630_g12_i0NODE_18_length_8108_cov_32_477630_g12_i0_p3_ORF_typecomplete_len461_score57_50Asp_protease/PF09668_10/3_1e50gagasp_proteas/PF13975_6/1_1e15RVP_2/PF08284_11/5_1e12Asp_protease_2/PF13650_6/2_4e11UBA/PF00627_31/6_4e10UN_NPL4/PF11543_8/2_5e07RVP/PF00077_20/2_9e07Ubiquitin_2/PF14560_6/2e06ubiquitin/PF00240_23/1_8e06DUF1758/PF05585_12/0_0002Peptidase_A2B/PF12384_8/7_1e05Peptidase